MKVVFGLLLTSSLSWAQVTLPEALEEENGGLDFPLGIVPRETLNEASERIDELEKNQLTLQKSFEEEMTSMQQVFGKKQSDLEFRLDAALDAQEGAELLTEKERNQRIEADEAWRKAVGEWRKKAEEAMRLSALNQTQSAVETTAKLAQDWQRERVALEQRVATLQTKLTEVEDSLQEEQATAKNNQDFEKLQLSFMQKSQALERFSEDSLELGRRWEAERKAWQEERALLEDEIGKQSGKSTEASGMLREVALAYKRKDEALIKLTTESEKLATVWNERRGGLQDRIAELEAQLSEREVSLQQALAEKTEVEKKEQAEGKTVDAAQKASREKMEKALATVTSLQQELRGSRQQEKGLRTGLADLQKKYQELSQQQNSYEKSRKEQEQAMAKLRDDLKREQAEHAETRKSLADAQKRLESMTTEVDRFRTQSEELKTVLAKKEEELKAVHAQVAQRIAAKEGEQNENKEVIAAKTAQIQNLEEQLGRMAVTQQELEGTLNKTLSEFEKLHKAYLEEKGKAGGARDDAENAEDEEKKAQGRIEALDREIRGQEKRVAEAKQKFEEKRKQLETATAALAKGKAALGKRESELQVSRQELADLKLGQQRQKKELNLLRKHFLQIEPVRYPLAAANVAIQQQRVLANVETILEVYPKAHFLIAGHTCNIGAKEANERLSVERAEVLRDYLVEKGVATEKIVEVAGYGDEKPAESNETDLGRQMNRRVEIQVVGLNKTIKVSG